MANILDKIDLLKIKPLPKKTTKYNVKLHQGIEKLTDIKVIDKTQEGLIDPIEFMKLLKKDVINKGDDFYKESVKTKEVQESQESQEQQKTKESKTTIHNIPFINDKAKLETDFKFFDYITNIEKTDIIIKIQQINSVKGSKPEERKTKIPEFKNKKETITNIDFIDNNLKINDNTIGERLHEIKPNILIKADSYYLNNREYFIEFINKLFLPYREELLQQEQDIKDGKITISCDDYSKKDFSLLIHQKIVRDYINLYTPYRGLLLYHGLGSGKTCSSIAISEGLKNDKEVIIMTPASLRDNYIEELKKCGDFMYKKNQYWEFINTKTNPEYIKTLSGILQLPEEYINKKGGAWLINKTKEPNYETEISLDDLKKKSLDEQINKMISNKYKFISYNGLRNNSTEWLMMTQHNKINPFSDKVIIIDEAHNLISRIINKLRIKSTTSLSYKIYNYLLSAENCKIILLSGTPIINYPNEIAVLFNILRGYINSYKFKISTTKTLTKTNFETILKKNEIYNHIDYIDYNSKTKELNIYKNPFGFVNTSQDTNKQVIFSNDQIYSNDFVEKIKTILNDNSINFVEDKDKNHIVNYKALPDLFEDFKHLFLNDNGELKNQEMFMRRIIGLTSYFRSAQEQLMPSYDQDQDFEVIEIPMSDSQFKVYNEVRAQERKIENNSKKKKKKKNNVAGNDEIFNDNISTYRIFSRAFCNFVFPKQDIERPMPKLGEQIETVLDKIDESENLDENVLDDDSKEDISKKVNEMDGNYEQEDIELINKENKYIKDDNYSIRIQQALMSLKKNSSKYLNKTYLQELSPKFLHILENIQDEENFSGIHLLYSQFKTLEGIGIFKLVLEENKLKESNTIFIELKLEKSTNGSYDLYIDPNIKNKIEQESLNVKFFASYTGSETREEREIILNILNSNWNVVPQNIITKIKDYIPNVENNNNGEVIKVLMISSSGAEGISLKNVRYVHIMEPYWHPVRKNQVIGRARRICSHSNLPPDLQFVKVFLYLMKFSDEQLKTNDALEIIKHDKSKIEKDAITGQFKVHTTDQFLNEISNIKESITNKLLNVVKSSSIDCVIHSKEDSKENIKCYLINSNSKTYNEDLMYVSNYENQKNDESINLNKKTIKSNYKRVNINGKDYLINTEHLSKDFKEKRYLYDYALFKKDKQLSKIGEFILNNEGKPKII